MSRLLLFLFILGHGIYLSCSVRHSSRLPHATIPKISSSKTDSLTQQHSETLVNSKNRELIREKSLDLSIQLLMQYFSAVCDSGGKFQYQTHLNPEIKLPPKYNILRHSGSLFAMASALKKKANKQHQETLLRATYYLKTYFIKPFSERSDLLAVWSLPEVEGDGDPIQVKLGGTALGLLALLSVEQVVPGTTSFQELQALGNGVLFMQKEDGSFYSKYIPAEGGNSDRWTSLYYPGEAALALVTLYEKDLNPIWLIASEKAMAYLARIRVKEKWVEPDHWALLATQKIMQYHHQLERPMATKQAILFHAKQIVQTLLPYSSEIEKKRIQQFGMTLDGRTCPTATRLEGLLSAYTFLPETESRLKQEILEVAEQGIVFLLQNQVLTGPLSGGIPRYTSENLTVLRSDISKKWIGEIRIDYVQHTLSAMLQYQEILQTKQK